MLELFRAPNYDFIGKRKWAYLVSAAFIVLGAVSLVVHGGLRTDIDFAGGTLVEVRFERPPAIDRIRATLTGVGLGDSIIQQFGEARDFIIRLKLGAAATDPGKTVQQALASDAGLGPFEIRRVEFVGPQVGRDLQLQALYAVLAGLAGILIYVAVRFDLKGGITAIVAQTHDVVVSIGALSLTDREFSLPVLAALLTVIGYSVNDKIVAYDRVRENRKRAGSQRGQPFAVQINTAINQTLSRTLLTGLSVLFAAGVLFLFGGKVLEDFAFTLIVGVVAGTYSTIYIAAALIVDWTQYLESRIRRSKKAVAKA
ncbi:MAG TPA: protein translocase subunit SecF [Methylomirabilota bacterium]|nr:protein translocase subunit SecF [Methylomirabilota bacterium]